MKTPEQRARRWLWIYPQAYRERRGEELLATLLDKARDDPRLPVREIRALMVHAGSMRVRQLRIVTIVLCVAVLGAGLGAAVGSLNGSTGYLSTTTVSPAQLGYARTPSPFLTEELRIQSTRFAAFRRTPQAQALLVHFATPSSCSVSVIDTVGSRGVQLQCSSPNAQTAHTVNWDLTQAIGLMFEDEQRATFAHGEA
jgi:hypothetical protein